ncbi:MAG: hypothetical protein R3275_13330, partial [Saprospiraceae bacterium]|nr:hypothetical protein [Saprospiraceae bacterium]
PIDMKFLSYIGKGFSALWVLWVVLAYFLFQPATTSSLVAMPYFIPVLFIAALAVTGHFLIVKKKRTVNWRGAYWFLGIILLSCIVIPSFYNKMEIESGSMISKLFYFSIFSLLLSLALTILFTSGWALGHRLITRLNLNLKGSTDLLSIALGVSIQTTFAVIAGMFGAMNTGVILVIIIVPLLFYIKPTWAFLKKVVLSSEKIRVSNSWELPIFLLLMGAFCVSWITAIKPFPHGNDGSSLYMYLAHKLADTGMLSKGGQSYAWSVYMAFGELVSGTEVLSILLSHAMGYLSMIALYNLLRRWMKRPHALLAVALAFMAPYFAFHSLVDEKIDLAVLFYSIVIIDQCLVFISEFKYRDKGSLLPPKEQIIHLVMIAWLCGFVFSMKYAFLIAFIALAALLAFRNLKRVSGAFFIFLAVLFLVGSNRFGSLLLSTSEKLTVLGGFMIIGIVLLVIAKTRILHLKRAIPVLGILFFVSVIPFTPWMIKHANENGSVSASSLLQGERDAPLFLTDPDLFGWQEPLQKYLNRDPRSVSLATPQYIDLQLDGDNDPPERKQSRYEELQRYLGFESGIWRYLSLPLDLTLSINVVGNRYLEIGFLFLCLVPFFFFSRKSHVKNIILGTVSILWISFSLYSINDYTAETRKADEILLLKEHSRQQPEALKGVADFLSDYVIHPFFDLGKSMSEIYKLGGNIGQGYSALLVSILLLIIVSLSLLPVKGWSSGYKKLGLVTLMTGLSWWLFGMGVVWYALPVFVLVPAILTYVIARPEKQNGILATQWTRDLFKGILFFQLAIYFLMYFTNPRIVGEPKNLFNWPSLEYATEPDYERADALGAYNPLHPQLMAYLNEDPDAKIYTVNTPLRYHIKNYEDRVFEDNLLTTYGDAKRKHGDALDYVEALRFNGYEYVYFNLRTIGMDKTPERSLAARCNQFLNELGARNDIYVLLTDRFVYDENAPEITIPSGQRVTARRGLLGQAVIKGSFVLFKVK